MPRYGEKCPDCGGPVRSYHSKDYTRIICAEKCKGWKVIRKIDRTRKSK